MDNPDSTQQDTKPIEPQHIETIEEHKGVVVFMSVALVVGFGLFVLLGFAMVKKPAQYASQATPRPYVSRYTSPTNTAQQGTAEIDNITIDDLDSEFKQVDNRLQDL